MMIERDSEREIVFGVFVTQLQFVIHTCICIYTHIPKFRSITIIMYIVQYNAVQRMLIGETIAQPSRHVQSYRAVPLLNHTFALFLLIEN